MVFLKMFIIKSYSFAINNSRYETIPPLFSIYSHQIKFCCLFWKYFTKLYVILTFHSYIHIIIPWNKTFVPYCTKQCAPVSKICYIMFLTYSVYLMQHFKLCCPYFFHHAFNIKAVADLAL